MQEPFAYFEEKFVPLSQAKIGIMTHAFNYGTGCFEGIRGNYNTEEKQLYLFRVREHLERITNSCKILKISLPHSVDDMMQLTVELMKMNDYQDDVYIRPLAYKSSEIVGVRLHDLTDGFLIFSTSLGNYLDLDKGIRCCTVSWRRVDDNMIPARAKVTGIYINSALAKTEAHDHGFDEAIMLTHDGHVSEGSGENIFIVSNGKLITPPPSDNILVGITRDTVMQLAREELGMETIERSIDKSELYVSEEVFMTGTAAHVTPVLNVDHRNIGNGEIGPITAQLKDLYFDVIYGRNKKYIDWCTPVYALAKV